MTAKTITTIALFVLIFSSCQRDEKISTKQEFQVNNGRLHFSSIENLNKFMKYAQNEDFNENYIRQLDDLRVNGFNSLNLGFEYSSEDYKSNYLNHKKLELLKFSNSGLLRTNFDQEIDDDDYIIYDPYFASILNLDREIQVGEMIYKYTISGVLYTDVRNEKKLSKFIQTAEAAGINQNTYSNPPSDIYLHQSYSSMSVYNGCIDPNARTTSGRSVLTYCYDDNPHDDSSDGGGGTGGSIGEGTPNRPKPDVYDLQYCTDMNNNLFTAFFGPSSTCFSYFYGDKQRIKTKAWNQNYLLYSSLGTSVKSQELLAGVWYLNKIDELELGYSFANFEFTELKPQWPVSLGSTFFFKYEGKLYNEYGSLISDYWDHPASLFQNVPIPASEEKLTFYYLTVDGDFPYDIVNDFTQHDVIWNVQYNRDKYSKYFDDIFKRGVKALERIGKLHFSSKTESEIDYNVITSNQDNITGLGSLYWQDRNYHKATKDDGSITKVFDWNTGQITITVNVGTGSTSFEPQFTAKGYNNLVIEPYGMGRKAGYWKGSRLLFRERK